MPTARSAQHVTRHHPLIGTVVELRVALHDTSHPEQAHDLDDLMVAEMARLERVCSAFDPTSELQRWKRGELGAPSADFCAVMAGALAHQLDSGGAFNPAAGVIGAAWRAAADAGGPTPDEALLADLAASIRAPRYTIDASGRPVATGDCSTIDLNAFAKGWIVDRALELGWARGVASSIVVNAGGDLAHRGEPAIRVGVENPLRPYDNEPPITTIELRDAGMATSGRARRGYRIGGRWYSHVIDPRSGRTVDDVASVSVVAGSAGTADAMATSLAVLPPDEAITEADRHSVACLRIATDGTRRSNAAWDDLCSNGGLTTLSCRDGRSRCLAQLERWSDEGPIGG